MCHQKDDTWVQNGTGGGNAPRTRVHLQLLGTAAPSVQVTSERPLHPRDSPPGLDFFASHSDFSLSLPFSLHNLLTPPCVLNNYYSYASASGMSKHLQVPFIDKVHISYVLLHAYPESAESLFERTTKKYCEEEK